MEKKINLTVSMEKSLKDRFIAAAKAQNTDGSKVVRTYILNYVEKFEKGVEK